MECLALLSQMRYAQRQLWFARPRRPAAARARYPSTAASCRPGFRPVLRRGSGRCRFAKWPARRKNLIDHTSSVSHWMGKLSKDGLCGPQLSVARNPSQRAIYRTSALRTVVCNFGARKAKRSAPKAAPAVLACANQCQLNSEPSTDYCIRKIKIV